MLVYVAYSLLVLHVTFGALQGEGSPIYVAATALGLVTVLALHIKAGKKEKALDSCSSLGQSDHEEASSEPSTINHQPSTTENGFIDACAIADIPENRARIVCLSGERVAIFNYEGKISAVSNVCQHQNGPLGEGKIVFGCITCPWHGYQYQPDTGASPPPFVEKVPTFNVRVQNGRVYVHPTPNPAGTRAEPASIDDNPIIVAAI
jgi:nitrite reductase/ring-hydroxylating ferredoxin subunit